MDTLKRYAKILLWLVLLPIFGPAYILMFVAGKWWEKLLDN